LSYLRTKSKFESSRALGYLLQKRFLATSWEAQAMATRVLTGSDVQRVVDELQPDKLIKMTRDLFQTVSSRKGITTPHRLSIDTGSQVSLFMPSLVESTGMAIKIVSVPKRGTAGIGATTLVIDPESGSVKGIVNARKLTALRTAAGSALATKLLANPSSRNLVVFGAGAQMEEHMNLLVAIYPSISSCVIVNRSQNARLEGMVQRLETKHQARNLEIRALTLNSPNVKYFVRKSDIICCATSSTEPLFPSSWVKGGTHINLIGSYKPTMHEIDTTLVRRAHKVVVDSSDACLREAGELIKADLKEDDLVELGIICGENQVTECERLTRIDQEKDVTIFKSVGVGAQDVMIAAAVLQTAEEIGLGTIINQYD